MITRVILHRFRGVADKLDLGMARLTLLSGRNGLGKTTVFDAIDWCLFGSSWRLGEEGVESNLYVTGDPCVEVTVQTEEGLCTVVRTRTAVTLDGRRVDDRELVNHFVTDPEVFPPYARDLQERVRRFVYLPQADVRGLLSPAAGSERLGLLQALLGVPYAAVVESSVRRMREYLGERLREQGVRIDELAADRAVLEQQVNAIAAESLGDMAPVMQRAESLLGDVVRQLSAEGLFQSCRAELDSARRRTERLRDLSDLLSSTKAKVAALSSSLASRQSDLRVFKESADRAGSDARQAQRGIETIRAGRGQEDRELEGLDRRRTVLRDALDSMQTLSGLDAELERGKRTYPERQAAVARYQEVANNARQQCEGAQRQHEQAVIRLNAVTQRLETAKDKQALTQQLSAATEAVRALEERLAAWQLRITDLEEAATEAESRLLLAGSAYRQRSEHSGFEERFRELVAQVVAALDSDIEPGKRCPLCGTQFPDQFVLKNTIRDYQAQQQDIETELVQARASAAKAREASETARAAVLSARSEGDSIARDLEEARGRKRDVAVRILSIRGELSVDHLEVRRREQERVVETRAAARAASERALSEAESAAAQAVSELNATKDQIAVGEARRANIREHIASVVNRLSPEDRNVAESMKKVAARIADLEERRAVRERDLTDALQASAAAGRTAEESAMSLAERQAAFEASIHERDELERRQENEVRDVLGEVSGDPLATSAEQLAAATERERALLSLSTELSRRVEAEQALLLRTKIGALESAQNQASNERDKVARAQARFETLASAVLARAEREASEGMRRHADAIQHCMDILYPHRHLDQIVVRKSDGSVLVRDDLLEDAVRPDLYASTGQANVLALSVFLATAMHQRATTLGCALLDEPVQNLDDVRFLALLTLLKRLAMSKQVVLSTSDDRVVELIRRQARSSWAVNSQDFVEYQWVGFDARLGPSVRTVPLRGTAAA